jgi:hypothetical protein
MLALVIVGTIPLSMWGSGCSSQPLVQPDAGQSGGAPGSGGVAASGGVPGSGGVSSGGAPGSGGHLGDGGSAGSQARDASVDGPSPCCLQSEVGVAQCSLDGQELRLCTYRLAQSDTRQCAPGTAYGYIWQVQTCPNGCVTVDAGVRGTGGATGSGGSGSGGNFGSGGTFGSGGSSPTGGSPGTSGMCR